MGHILLGTILLLTAIAFFVIPIIACPKLEGLGARHGIDVDHGRHSFAALMVGVGAYLGWIAALFYGDELGPENYALGLWIIRIIVLVAAWHFAYAAWKADV